MASRRANAGRQAVASKAMKFDPPTGSPALQPESPQAAVASSDAGGHLASLRKEDFRYELPPRLIAQEPSAERGQSRLLVLPNDATDTPSNPQIAHHRFTDLPGFLRAGDLLVVNDTRVVKARLAAEKDSGGQAELLLERVETERIALCQVRVSKPLKEGRTLLAGGLTFRVVGRAGQFYRIEFPGPVLEVLDALGSVPLPPYITRSAEASDEERYQTVWNRHPGAVAAPTAGLHFTEALLSRIREQGVRVESVTLHVGAGTFQPVRVSDLDLHRMHEEHYLIEPAVAEAIVETAARGGRIVAVGTTVVRALESAALGPYRVASGAGKTALFITPGYRFQVVDSLVTNFHLPESTLLMLIAAFAGYERVMAAYAAAVAEEYRFFSYGDAMLLQRALPAGASGEGRI